jgi:EmrB/QacA subfamily drug resistance transporter
VVAVGVDGTVLSIALPTLSQELHASESDLQWFSSGYFLVLAAAMLPAGLLGDRYGRKKLLLISLVLFGFGSAACAYSTSVGEFIAARVVLGLAGAGVIVMALSSLTVLFDESERPKAVGVWAAANFASAPIGPILGGWILTHYWWGWVFLMNIPVVIIGLLTTASLVRESRASQRPDFDPVGMVSSAGGLVAITYGFIQAGVSGWTDPLVWLYVALGVFVLIGFYAWERNLSRRAGSRPLVDPALFRSKSYLWGVILAAFAVMAMVGLIFTMPQYFQGVLGTTAMASGVRLLPLIGGMVVGVVPANIVGRRVGAKAAATLGFLTMAAGLALGGTTGTSSGPGFVALWMAIAGLGLGMAVPTMSSVALSQLSRDQAGIGSAVLQAINKTGGPLGAAIVGSVVSAGYLARLNVSGLPAATATAARHSVFGADAAAEALRSPALTQSAHASFVHGMDLALVVSAAIAGVGALLAMTFLPSKAVPAGNRPTALTAELVEL